jgi:hypothetical protein
MEVKAIDTLTLLSGKQVQITDKIIYSQPKLLDVIRFGEQEYYQILSNMTAIPSDMKSVLWDAGIDWMEFSDMELFYVMTERHGQRVTGILECPQKNSPARLIVDDENDLGQAEEMLPDVSEYLKEHELSEGCEIVAR